MLPGALAIRLLGLTAHASFIIAAAAAAASAPGDQAAEELVYRCGNTHPSKELVDAHEELQKKEQQHKTRSIDANETINIDTYLHVVMSHQDNQTLANDSTNKTKHAQDTMLNNQMDVLNKAFEESKFHFNLKKIRRVNNETWAWNNHSLAMRRQLRQGDQKTLNVYILEGLRDLVFGKGSVSILQGQASTPDHWGRSGLEADYVNIIVDVIAGASNRISEGGGITLVHEVGHWLGLLHPHEYGCDGGDFIDDTPAMARPVFNCTRGLDSCPGPKYKGEDPIHNYMTYGPDSCRNEFTKDQRKRMRDLWGTFRLFKNEPESSWKNDCQDAFIALRSHCMKDMSKNNETCEAEWKENKYLACTPLSPNTKRECLDRFVRYEEKCNNSTSCEVDFANSYEKFCAAERRVFSDASNDGQKPKLSQTEADKQWKLVCRQATSLVQEQCTKSECQKEMVSGSLFTRCAKAPQDSKQCQDVLDPLVKLCETDKCRQGLEALKSKECVAGKDPVAEYNGGIVTNWDLHGDMAPITRDEWRKRCNEVSKAMVRHCEADKACIDNVKAQNLSSFCQKDRPKSQADCKAEFDRATVLACASEECRNEVLDLENKACAGRSSI
ncbi:peptidase M43 family protein [Metarhizium robertsii]|uniref:Metalloprotease MEP1-like protein n=2 Tax=Metarhizium robertsii TaxID=568076 RepID=E9F4J2_METRA|nr:metalloprotease MEP1-like protein [Metarhizium robertsii ARSEF 23]EFY97549.1 metalloprotease MEP1-like protein [Metarhizium robertsii ARSEF 23]EXU99626.1 peptidase M43 family protein [Metarhizium robertsii]